jgi:hypothetical protein
MEGSNPAISAIYKVYEKSGTNGNFNYFLFFIYRLKLTAKRLNMALTLDERVEIALLSGRQGWCMLLKSEIFVALGRELQTYAAVDTNMLSKIRTNVVKRLRKCVVSGRTYRAYNVNNKFPLVPDFSDTSVLCNQQSADQRRSPKLKDSGCDNLLPVGLAHMGTEQR